MKPLVAAVAVLVALAVAAPVQAQTPEIDALRARADQGDAVAQNLLGTMYRNGEDVSQDDVLAHMWYSLSASRATSGLRERAVQGRDRAAGQMNPTQIAEAERLAREWDAAHPRAPY